MYMVMVRVTDRVMVRVLVRVKSYGYKGIGIVCVTHANSQTDTNTQGHPENGPKKARIDNRPEKP